MSPADLLVDSGQCLLDLGQTTRAHQLIGEGMDLLPRARSKTRAVFLIYEAGSYLKAGEPGRAAAVATESLTPANKIGAPPMRRSRPRPGTGIQEARRSRRPG
ncbi:hypothetical protein [Streptomyces chattanoogensis]|uniref:hypothetical protein n=1 Tax=Streptomyces chattanoogensis TaxID=66876 RepID=UPI00367E1580